MMRLSIAAPAKIGAVLLVVSLLGSAAHAMPTFDQSRAGIDNLDIGGTPYNVTFVSGTSPSSFNAVYDPGGTCTAADPFCFPFTTEAAAETAAQAIIDFLNSNAGIDNLAPGGVPAPPNFQFFSVPYQFSNPQETIVNVRQGRGQSNVPDPANQWVVPPNQPGAFSTTQFLPAGRYWTTFTVVPEPSSLGLLGAGLLGFGLIHRRRAS